jgi:hypothetical protein
MTIALPSSCLSVVNNANGTALPDKPGVAKANGTSRTYTYLLTGTVSSLTTQGMSVASRSMKIFDSLSRLP